jgi:hypothetical protein
MKGNVAQTLDKASGALAIELFPFGHVGMVHFIHLGNGRTKSPS